MRKRVQISSVCLALACVGCAGQAGGRAGRIAVEGRRFVLGGEQGRTTFVPWGFNYDRTVVDGRDMLLEDVLAGHPRIVDEDFAAMHRLGGNTVRVFIATSEILAGPGQVSKEGLARLDQLLGIAGQNGLRLILTGLATLRPATIPPWIQTATDEQMERAEILFWQTVARACRGRDEIFCYDLQNEPAVHWSNSDKWVEGCFDMPDGQRFCYVHRKYRQIGTKWTRHIHEKYAGHENLKQRWPDYPRAGEHWNHIAVPAFDAKDVRFKEYAAWHRRLLPEWAGRLAETIRTEDPHRLVTVGVLLDPVPLADVVDFHCCHLYPRPAKAGEDWLAENRRGWRDRMAALPADKPVLIEEFYPMGMPEDVSAAEALDAMLDATRDHCAGWISFYWGPAERLGLSDLSQRKGYDAWLTAWSGGAQTRRLTPAPF